MFAVVKTGGKQYKVAADDVITVERLSGDVDQGIMLDEVLMMGEGADMEIGAPLVDGARVSAQIVEQGRGDKIIVFKKKRRHNYRRKKGHRQDLTTLKILEILPKGAEPSKKAEAQTEEKKPKKTAKPADDQPAASDAAVEGVAPQSLEAPNGEPDDLSKISGVGPKLVEKLNGFGIFHFSQIAEWTPENVAWIDENLQFKGRIERDDWIEQAKQFMADANNED